MAEEDDAQKTEDPTEKKLSRARGKGQVAQSQEVKSVFILMAGAGALIFLAPFAAYGILNQSIRFVEQPHMFTLRPLDLQQIMAETVWDAALVTLPVLFLIFFFGVAANIFQFGLLLAPEKIKPDVSKLSLIKGVQRMFSLKSTVEFLKGIGKLLMVAGLSIALSVPMLSDLEMLPAFSMAALLDRLMELIIVMAVAAVFVMLAIASIDFIYQKYEFTKSMRMSKQEVKDEHKQAEGDPQVKAKIRSLRQQRAKERMMAAVPESDVVITNPTHFAVALKYDMEEMAAPVLVAKGVDAVAFRIREVADENDVPIVENPPLARALFASVELDEQIPSEHFVAVAEVIGYVMRQKGKTLN